MEMVLFKPAFYRLKKCRKLCSAAMGAVFWVEWESSCLFSECTIIEDEGSEDIISSHNTGEENLCHTGQGLNILAELS